MSYPDQFQDLETFIYGSDQPIDDSQSTEIGSEVQDDISFFAEFVEEQADGHSLQKVEGVQQESDRIFVEALTNINNYQAYDISGMPSILNTDDAFGGPRPNLPLSAMGNPYQTGITSSMDNQYRTEYQFAMPRRIADLMFSSTDLQESSFRHPSQLHPYQNCMQVAEQTPIVASNESYKIHNAQPKRETSATISRRLSEISPEGEHAVQNKRKRSDGDVEPDGEDASRPRYARRILNENARYRNALRNSRPEPPRPEGIRSLFDSLRSEIVPKRAYYRKKGANATASHQPIPSTASTALPGTGEEASSSTPNRRSRQGNSRRHIPVETVRQTAPEGWDRFDNEYYSGDDNVSDGGIEARGKATDWKPPRMACRRCNKFKQPCDHAYPACSLCAKYGLRCRYRDDLTGRQIRPGQLEEVEVALHDTQAEIKRLQEKVKKLEEAQNPRDDAQN